MTVDLKDTRLSDRRGHRVWRRAAWSMSEGKRKAGVVVVAFSLELVLILVYFVDVKDPESDTSKG